MAATLPRVRRQFSDSLTQSHSPACPHLPGAATKVSLLKRHLCFHQLVACLADDGCVGALAGQLLQQTPPSRCRLAVAGSGAAICTAEPLQLLQ